jgi:voltage-gated potassium channel Kch
MSIAVDASSPARWTGQPANGGTLVSASFTAPADALLVVTLQADGDSTANGTVGHTVTDSGGLAWTKQVERLVSEATDGGTSAIWTARTTSAVARTITITRSHTLNTAQTRRVSAVCRVLTGVDVDGTPVDTVSASNEGGSAGDANNDVTTTSLVPGATGLLIVSDLDWNTNGAMSSSNLTIDHQEYAGEIDVIDGYRTCTAGVSVSANLNAAGTGSSAQHKWTQIIVREAAATAMFVRPQITRPFPFKPGSPQYR